MRPLLSSGLRTPCSFLGKPMGLSIIKNCFIFILAPIISMQYDWADASTWHPNIVNSPLSLPPYKVVIGGAAAPAANAPPPPPYCMYPPPAKPALPAPLPSAPGESPPAGRPPSVAPPGSSSSQPAPLFLPPVAFPAPPPGRARAGLWCVASPAAASAVVKAAMDYACGSGADCSMVAAPGGPCYLPDTLVAHASFAFNSCWQHTRVAGGTCDFGGAAMLVTRDPSYDDCKYIAM